MIDKIQIQNRFKRSISSYDANALVQKSVIGHLCGLIARFVAFRPAHVLEIGCGTGLMTERLAARFGKDALAVNDLVEEMCLHAAGRCGLERRALLPGDIEGIGLGGPYGLIVSASTFQWLARPSATFARLSAALEDGGMLVFSSFGADNCLELRETTGMGLEYRSLEDMLGLLEPCFEVLHAGERREVLPFSRPYDILQHVRKTGVNAMEAHGLWTRGRLEAFAGAYEAFRQEDGSYPLTYHPQFFVCRKRL